MSKTLGQVRGGTRKLKYQTPAEMRASLREGKRSHRRSCVNEAIAFTLFKFSVFFLAGVLVSMAFMHR
ncbi:MAG: hypothetical protein KGL39_52225 [Patescibacteria group bacterium]|nr:hypothetical protein [Patescibacteria group bacterium]